MATFIEDLTLKAMAEDLAYLGEQDPKLTLCPLGVINAYSKDNLATPQVQIDLRQHLQAAWPVLLDQLRERNIPIPQQLQTPHFFGMSETVCVTTTRKALEVSAWIKEGTEAAEGEICVGNLIIYPLADPIRIQYSDLGLPDINSGMIGITTDHILTLSDTDGLEMHRLQPVEWTDDEGNTHPALITRWSQAYMDKHHAWPPALPMTYTGLQFTADYKEMRWLHDTVLKLITKYPV